MEAATPLIRGVKLLTKLIFILALISFTACAEAGDLVVDGLVQHEVHLAEADIAALPATELDASFQTGHGADTAHYKGVLLWSLVEKAGLALEPGKRTSLRHYLLIFGRDGHAVAVSIGELDPDFEGKQAILAYARDGKALDGDEVRLIIPGDKHGGRAVHDVARVEVK